MMIFLSFAVVGPAPSARPDRILCRTRSHVFYAVDMPVSTSAAEAQCSGRPGFLNTDQKWKKVI
jgi:hypothetical protein